MKGRVLVVDDEKNMGLVIQAMLERAGFEVLGFQDSQAALEAIENEDLDVIVTDLYMPGAGGMEILTHAKRHQPKVPIVMITAFGTVESAVSALKNGAFDFITKPFEQGELLAVVEKATRTHLERQKEPEGRERESASDRAVSDSQFDDDDRDALPALLGRSLKVEEVRRKVERAASVESHIWIEGESGAGRELVAQEIHSKSARKGKPLIKLNCAVVPKELLECELFGHEKGAFNGAISSRPGRFELAHEGVLFLDEALELTLETQGKLLNALRDGEFERVGGMAAIRADVRVISASEPGLREAVRKGDFLEELYYQLSVGFIELPPLRDRKEDIEDLVLRSLERFSKKFGKELGPPDERLLSVLQSYRWPGNLRQLENVIERMVLMAGGDGLSVSDLPEEIFSDMEDGFRMGASEETLSFKERIRRQTQTMERELIEKALAEENWNVTRTAEKIGLSRKGLQLKMKELGIRRR